MSNDVPVLVNAQTVMPLHIHAHLTKTHNFQKSISEYLILLNSSEKDLTNIQGVKKNRHYLLPKGGNILFYKENIEY